MKRLLLFSALLLTACHASRPHFTVGVSQCSDDAWRQKMNNEMQTEALLYDNLELEIRSAGGDSERQIADIRHFIEQGVDLLIVAPNEAIPVTPVVEEAYARGIPVIVVDRKILSDHYGLYRGGQLPDRKDHRRIRRLPARRPGRGDRADRTERIDAGHRPSSGFRQCVEKPSRYPGALQRGCPLAAFRCRSARRFALPDLSGGRSGVRPQRPDGPGSLAGRRTHSRRSDRGRGRDRRTARTGQRNRNGPFGRIQGVVHLSDRRRAHHRHGGGHPPRRTVRTGNAALDSDRGPDERHGARHAVVRDHRAATTDQPSQITGRQLSAAILHTAGHFVVQPGEPAP